MSGALQFLIGLVLTGGGVAIWRLADARALVEPYLKAIGGTDVVSGFGLALVAAGGLWLLTGLLTAIIGGATKAIANARNTGDAEKLERRRIETFHRILGGVVGRVAGADGKVKDAELAMVSGLIEKFGGVRLTDEQIRSLSDGGVEKAQSFIEAVKKDRAEITTDQKRSIVRAALLVALSDLQLDEREAVFIQSLAEALGLTKDDLGDLQREVGNVTQKLIGAAALVA